MGLQFGENGHGGMQGLPAHPRSAAGFPEPKEDARFLGDTSLFARKGQDEPENRHDTTDPPYGRRPPPIGGGGPGVGVQARGPGHGFPPPLEKIELGLEGIIQHPLVPAVLNGVEEESARISPLCTL